MMNNIVIFLGPSLQIQDAHKYLDAIYLPPAKQGDIISAISNYNPIIIGLIDGEFYQSSSVWHKEILYAIQAGIKVYGASSMGALRAVELNKYGMVGIGKVYQSYKKNEINRDDEVALIYSDKSTGYINLTYPLVNIKATLHRLHDKKLIDENIIFKIRSIAEKIHFKERSLINILNIANLENEAKDKVILNFNKYYLDLKKNDAVKMLKIINNNYNKKFLKYNDKKSTKYINHALYNHERKILTKRGTFSLSDFSNYLPFNLKNFDEINFNALNKHLVRIFAEYIGLEIHGKELERELVFFKVSKNIVEKKKYLAWLKLNDINECDLTEIIKDMVYAKKMHKWLYYGKKFVEKNSKILLDELRIKGSYSKHKNLAAKYQTEAMEIFAENHAALKFPKSKIDSLFFEYISDNNKSIWSNWEIYMEENGFQHEYEFARSLFANNKINYRTIKRKTSNLKCLNWHKINHKSRVEKIFVNVSKSKKKSVLNKLAPLVIKNSLINALYANSINLYWIVSGKNTSCLSELEEIIFNSIEKYNIFERVIDNHFVIDNPTDSKHFSYKNDFFKCDLILNLDDSFNANVLNPITNTISNIYLVISSEHYLDAINLIFVLNKLHGKQIYIGINDKISDFIKEDIALFQNLMVLIFKFWLINNKTLYIINFIDCLKRINEIISNQAAGDLYSSVCLSINDGGDIFLSSDKIIEPLDFSFRALGSCIGNIRECDGFNMLYDLKYKQLENFNFSIAFSKILDGYINAIKTTNYKLDVEYIILDIVLKHLKCNTAIAEKTANQF